MNSDKHRQTSYTWKMVGETFEWCCCPHCLRFVDVPLARLEAAGQGFWFFPLKKDKLPLTAVCVGSQ